LSTSISKILFGYKGVFYFLLAFAVTILIARQLPADDVDRFFSLRFKAVLEIIDKFEVGTTPTVVAFGPSDINLNFSPRLIQKKFPSSIHFRNLGVVMAGPPLLEILTSRFAERLKARGEMVDVSLIRFMPMTSTKTFVEKFATIHPYFRQFLPLGAGGGENFGDLADRVYLRLINGGFQQGIFRRWLIPWLETNIVPFAGDTVETGVDYRYRNAYRAFWKKVADEYHDNLWPVEFEGEWDAFSTRPEHLNLQAFVGANKNELFYGGLETHERLYGALKLDFDKKTVMQFLAAVENLKKISKKVAILYLPEHFAAIQRQREPSAKQALNKVLRKLKSDPTVEFLDYSGLALDDDDFIDITHMTPSGKDKLNSELARDLTALANPVADTKSYKIKYVEKGTGQPLILLHGLTGDWTRWGTTIDLLAKNHRVIALDQLGFGESDKPDIAYSERLLSQSLAQFMKDKHISRATIVGHSMGAGVAYGFAVDHPDMVEKLILVDGGPLRCTELSKRDSRFVLSYNKAITRASVRQELEEMFFDKTKITAKMLDDRYRTEMESKLATASLVDAFITGRGCLTNGQIAALETPTLIIWGRHDGRESIEFAKRLREDVGNSELQILEESGHFPPLEQPETLVGKMQEFMAKTNP
jgi:pimeloyl-ACP methyl ester carboxylesterase